LIAISVAATGSLSFMFYAARRQQSILLFVLFTGWVLAPFCALTWAVMASKNRAPLQTVIPGLTYLVTLVSLTIYGTLAMGMLKAKNGFIFLVVPAGTWLLIAVALALVALKSR
jgi:hypothetical protein